MNFLKSSYKIIYIFNLSQALIEKEPYVEFRDLDPDTFEWSTVILWILACFCVAVGALTAPYYEPHKYGIILPGWLFLVITMHFT